MQRRDPPLNGRAKAGPQPGAAAPLDEWMRAQYALSALHMAGSISATHLTRRRAAFGQAITPKPGSVLASPAPGFYDPDPDYFFHWLRDSALVMDACAVLIRDALPGADWARHFADFVRFSLGLNRLQGRELHPGRLRRQVAPDFRRFVRPAQELRGIAGDRVLEDVRFNPDGTLDIIRWSRPQQDGPALRALAVVRHWRLEAPYSRRDREAMAVLLLKDLDFVLLHWDRPSYDLWEDNIDRHYHTQLVQHAALLEGAVWAESHGQHGRAGHYRRAAALQAERLDALWSPDEGLYRSRAGSGFSHPKQPDIAVILAVIQARLPGGRHSVLDDRVHATLLQLEDVFAADYAINRSREPGLGRAMGRFRGDLYFSGGAYYFATLGTAEFYYRLAAALRRPEASEAAAEAAAEAAEADGALLRRALREAGPASGADRAALVRALIGKGDAIMAMVRKYTPVSGALSEQFDQTTGAQTSAKDLAWSYAAFITAFDARRQALA